MNEEPCNNCPAFRSRKLGCELGHPATDLIATDGRYQGTYRPATCVRPTSWVDFFRKT